MSYTANPFDGKGAVYEDWFHENELLFSSEVSAVKKLFPSSASRSVEIGVGTGLFSEKLNIREGVDSSLDMAEKALQKGISVKEGFAEALPLESSAYDAALMVTVDCFLSDTKKAFSEIYRILKPSGSFVIAFINRNSPLGQQYEKFKEGDPYYQTAVFHSAEEISLLLQQAGFIISDSCQTVYTLENTVQEVKSGFGEGVFTVIRAEK